MKGDTGWCEKHELFHNFKLCCDAFDEISEQARKINRLASDVIRQKDELYTIRVISDTAIAEKAKLEIANAELKARADDLEDAWLDIARAIVKHGDVKLRDAWNELETERMSKAFNRTLTRGGLRE